MEAKSEAEKVAVVTGASRGLGAAISGALVGLGYRVAGVGRDRALLAQRSDELGRDRFRPYAADLTDSRQIVELLSAIQSEMGDPNVLINNAGYGGAYGLLHDTDDAQWSQALAVNVTAPFTLMRAFIPAMGRAKFGRIINISSVFGVASSVGSAAYTASKHALIGLTKSAAVEYAASGITCNALCPGFCSTDMTAGLAGNEMLLARIPAGRFGQSAEVANLVVWLCSEQSAYINGAVLPIDGGLAADLAPIASTRASF